MPAAAAVAACKQAAPVHIDPCERSPFPLTHPTISKFTAADNGSSTATAQLQLQHRPATTSPRDWQRAGHVTTDVYWICLPHHPRVNSGRTVICRSHHHTASHRIITGITPRRRLAYGTASRVSRDSRLNSTYAVHAHPAVLRTECILATSIHLPTARIGAQSVLATYRSGHKPRRTEFNKSDDAWHCPNSD